MFFMKFSYLRWLFVCLFVSCQSDTATVDQTETRIVTDSVKELLGGVEKDIALNGPISWLNYFEDSPDFYMASDGELAFNNYQNARSFIEKILVNKIKRVKLQLNHVRIDPLTRQFASIGADFHEEMTDSAEKIIPVEGYFTAVARQTDRGWKLRSLHWSILPKK
jgi:SnoaL-like domain